MTKTKLEYIAMTTIGTDPPWEAGVKGTDEQVAQLGDKIRDFVYLGQIQTKTATKRTLKKEIKEQ